MAQDVGSSHSPDKPEEKLEGPEAAVESEAKLIKVALQMLFAQVMISSQKEGLQIGEQNVYPAQSAAVLVKDLVMVGIPLTQRGAKRPEGVGYRFRCQDEQHAG